MTALPTQHLPAGYQLFARYAFPPNELGYCGPADPAAMRGDNPAELASRAREFDGAWPYLHAIAEATGTVPLDPEVVRSYWVGGPLLDRVDPIVLLAQLRVAFQGQVTGGLDTVTRAGTTAGAVLAHHSFHVFVVYPWIRFLDRDPGTALQVLQNCRIRWGTVTAVEDEHVALESCPLMLDDSRLTIGEPVTERVRWSKDGKSLTTRPAPGDTVSAHWNWVCDTLTPDETSALADATRATLDLVNKGGRP
ncbi:MULTISPECIES: DUF6390 family protein [unclassified Mycolicibacterium]|uniref:DUF6390 family protein n=1 Tax=unclassified Mycolicibacterium TaxID=2636767 RepID=UPI0012DCC106|nr:MULTISPECIES: DUF6390 family protein [unclassified Mycolicibacterium]MUL80319.1 hypothetical protein [Mycolicibacterium sp. CBMA 329]MUL86086.1 hypothetical protein [Mycolicibacterium sp. CBMA 331]MUM00860.1 hypothetical protein [Mycolicibacterium sp. CBMA 334]MUM26188.1 hypothetical protein [Mycolicibacterium sp. CBMA 295]MUM36382.1 hypothetical protein [Mycolicibacterium sp. CBMA 247]